MGRPFILVGGLIAYFLGLSIAYHNLGTLKLLPAFVGLLILIMGTIMAHYANEYADVDTDTFTHRTWFSGGSGVLPSGIIPSGWALWAAIILAILTIIVTLLSFSRELMSIQSVLIVFLGILGGWFYSMPPLRLEMTVWGGLDNALLGGYLMPLFAYILQIGFVNLKIFLILTPILMAVLVNLIGVHWADREADAKVGKNTLVVRLSSKAPTIHFCLIGLVYIFTIVLLPIIPWQVVIATLFTIPLAIWAYISFERNSTSSSFFMGAVMIFGALGWILS
jgi:1,4-dihydroxy-2-naphthoate polyprenyltransferase